MTSIRCPRCGATITTRGVSHVGPGLQWECHHCGYIEQDNGNYWTEREAGPSTSQRRCVHGVPLNVFCGKCES